MEQRSMRRRLTAQVLALAAVGVSAALPAACGSPDAHGGLGSQLHAAGSGDGGAITGGGATFGDASDAAGAATADSGDATAATNQSDTTSDGADPTAGPASIVATAAVATAAVGAPLAIVCEVRDGHGAVLQPAPPGVALLTAAPLQQVDAAAGFGLAVTSKQAGTFDVRCALPSASLVSSPVAVTFAAGAAASVHTSLSPETVTAGDGGAKVSCVLRDSFGNAVGGKVQATVSADDGVMVAIDLVSGSKAGSFAVRCVPAGDHAALPAKPAVLTVVPGAAMRGRAVVTPTKAAVDVPFAVACTAYDDWDNPVAPQPPQWALQLPTGCQATGLAFTCTTAGKHEVGCATPSVPKVIPTPFTVVAGKAVSLKLLFDPEQPNYATGQVVQLLGQASDKHGNPLEDPELKPIQVVPADVVTLDAVNAQVSFGQDGLYTVTVGVAGAPGVVASRPLLVDTSGPLIHVAQPPRGHTMLHAAAVKVTFSVIDELSKLVSVRFDSKDVPFADGIGIQASQPLGHGVTPIRIEGKDVWGNASRHVQAVLAAKKFAKTETKGASAAKLDHGMALWLGQEAIDSGVRVHSKPRDLATVLEIVLKNMDLSIIVGKSFPVDVTGLKGNATITGLTYGDSAINKGYPKINLAAKAGGLALDGRIYDVEAKVNLKGTGIGFIPVNVDATVTADSLRLQANLLLAAANGSVTVKTKDVVVTLDNLDVNIDNSWGFLVNWLLDLFNGSITSLFESTLASQLAAAVDGPLGQALTAIGLDTTFDVPGFLGGSPTTVALSTVPQALQVHGATSSADAGAWLKMRTAITSNRKVPWTILGAPLRWSCLGAGPTWATFARKEPLEVALHFDLANQLFAALWQAGGLDVTLGAAQLGGFDLAAFGLKDIAVEVRMLLPPVLSDCTVGGKPELQLGDVRLDVKTTMDGKEVIVRAWLTAAAQVAVAKVTGAAGPEIGLNVLGISLIETDVESVLVGGVAAPEGTVGFFEKLLPLVANVLVGALQGTLASFPLPELDLSLMGSAIPKGTVLALDIKTVGAAPGHVTAVGGVKK